MKPSYTELDEQVVEVYAHLLEILQVENTTDLAASATAATAATKTRGEKLVARIMSI
jgi:hypothetical protein